MAEYTAISEQTVAVNSNVLLTETPVDGGRCVIHREGAGLVTLRGITNQCRSRYRALFNANIAIPTGGTVGAISLAISLNGEAVQSTTMIVTPAAVEEYFNVSASVYVDVPNGCCTQVAIRNTSDQAILVQNANLIVERVA